MNLQEILGLIGISYESISRLLPTKKNWSLIHAILQALLFLSKGLNNKKKDINNLPVIVSIVFASMFFTSCKVLKNIDCKSTKYVTVTVLDKAGRWYSVNVPYCDTVLLTKDNIDTTKTLQYIKQ